jgi:hypothetical protein
MAEVAERKVRDAERSTQSIRDLVRRQETLSEDWLRPRPRLTRGHADRTGDPAGRVTLIVPRPPDVHVEISSGARRSD